METNQHAFFPTLTRFFQLQTFELKSFQPLDPSNYTNAAMSTRFDSSINDNID